MSVFYLKLLRGSRSIYTDIHSKIDFTVRYCKAVSAVDSTGYRVIYGGEIYNILGIDHKNFKKKSVKLKCQKVRR